MIKDDYKGKLFSILGDSISTLDGYNPPGYDVFYEKDNKFKAGVYMPSDTWWGQVIDALGGELLRNNSWSGSMVCMHPFIDGYSYGASDERTSSLDYRGITPDVVMIYMGTNDWGNGTRINTLPGEKATLATFRYAYSEMLRKIKKNYPAAEIWCFTLGVSKCNERPLFEFPFICNGRHIEDYCFAIRECAEKAGCRIIDLYNGERFDTIEGFHPNAEGMKCVAGNVLRCLHYSE